jgi:acyl-coenzyme A synthetase/AMP-(fatty) acid ligase
MLFIPIPTPGGSVEIIDDHERFVKRGENECMPLVFESFCKMLKGYWGKERESKRRYHLKQLWKYFANAMPVVRGRCGF